MSSHLNKSNRNGNKKVTKGHSLSKSKERIDKAMKAPIKHVPQSETTYVWQEEGSNESVGWDANGSPSVTYDEDSIKGVSRHKKSVLMNGEHGIGYYDVPDKPKTWKDAFLHDWSDDILHLTCKYCNESPCECDMSDISI
jgi:hypothetical protein